MLIKDIVIAALSLAGRHDAAEALSSGEYEGERELEHAISAMLHCVNATEDELARAFFPLEREEEFKATGGRIYYTVFAKTPVKILSVTRGGRPVKHEIWPEYLAAEGTVMVRYAYCPTKKSLSDQSDYDGYPVGERMIAYGAASEYCLIEGAYEQAENWEQRYRQEVERLRPRGRVRPISARAWI